VLEDEGEALCLEKPNNSPLDPPFEIERVRYNDKSPSTPSPASGTCGWRRDLVWDASLIYDVTSQPTVALPQITPAGGAFASSVHARIIG
jgi:hypothetical protein